MADAGAAAGFHRGAPSRKRATLARAPSMLRRRPTRRVFKSALSTNVHRHTRFETTDREFDLTGTSTPNEAFHAWNFRLSFLQNNSELTVLYDQYRIDKVVLYLNWTPFEGAGVGATDTVFSPVLMYFTDYDDDAVPSASDFRERATAKQIRLAPNKQHILSFKPAVLSEVYRSLTTTSYVPKFGQKLDCDTNDVPHFGFKGYARGRDGVNSGKINVRIRYYITCYGTR